MKTSCWSCQAAVKPPSGRRVNSALLLLPALASLAEAGGQTRNFQQEASSAIDTQPSTPLCVGSAPSSEGETLPRAAGS